MNTDIFADLSIEVEPSKINPYTQSQEIIASAHSGIQKGNRDSLLAAAHLEEVGKLNPDEPFWDTLANDVNKDDPVEIAAYSKIQNAFMTDWLARHPLETASIAFDQRAVLLEQVRAQYGPDTEILDDVTLAGPRGEELIEKYIKGATKHESMEDVMECEVCSVGVKVLQNRRAMLLLAQEAQDAKDGEITA